MSTVGTDKLAEALTEIRCPMDPDPLGKVYADHVAAWLRSPAGIAALTGDETIREGILHDHWERTAGSEIGS